MEVSTESGWAENKLEAIVSAPNLMGDGSALERGVCDSTIWARVSHRRE